MNLPLDLHEEADKTLWAILSKKTEARITERLIFGMVV